MRFVLIQLNLAMRNARRNLRRTLLTAATVAIGVALTTLSISFLSGYMGTFLDDMAENHGHVRIVNAAYAERENLRPMYENIADSDALAAKVLAQPGITSVEPVIRTGVVLATGEEIGEDFAPVIGARESFFRDHLRSTDHVVAGTWITGPEEIVVGRKVAKEVGIEVGQEILVLGTSQYGSMSPMSPTVVGIVSQNGLVDSTVFMSLEDARWMADMPDGSVELLAFTDDKTPAALDALMADLTASGAVDGHSLRGWHQEPLIAQSLPMMGGIQAFISMLMMFVMVLAIFNTMTMSVLERTGEIGVMRALGQTRLGAIGLFLVEAVTIGAIGGAIGVLVGGLGGYYFEVVGVDLGQDMIDQAGASMPISSVIYGDVTPALLVQSLILGLVTAALGALLPSLRAASIQPSEAMRARR